MSVAAKGIFIVGAKRTAFGKFGGAFKNTSSIELQTLANTAAIQAAGLKPDQIDTVNIGNVLSSTSTDGVLLPRHSAIKAAVPIEKPALGINRLCGTGFQAVVNGAQDILTGAAKVSLTGGAENMSQAPFVVRGVRFGTVIGQNIKFEDSLWSSLTDTYCNLPMGLTAEKLGAQFDLTRTQVDEFALRSQQRWKAGNDAGVFKAEITPVTVQIKNVVIEVDEHPRPQTTMEILGKLPTIFKKDGIVTAGSASGLCDGAAAVIVASEAAVKDYNLKPLARLVGWSVVGCEPSIMGIGPVPAIQNLLKVTNLTLNDIDLVEINEAFGAQVLSCAKALKLDMDKLNVNGGAIALGHPLAASGARITAHLVYELRRRGLKRGIGACCIGGGQGIALLVEVV